MTMYKDPITWNANRQLLGEEIRVYMADSTIRFAHVIASGAFHRTDARQAYITIRLLPGR